MEKHRIRMSDIVIGKPLPWNVFDIDNKLLLRKGHIIERENQIEVLMERGLFVDSQAKADAEEPPPTEQPSALRQLHNAGKRLDRLYLGLSHETDAPAQFIDIAQSIAVAADINTAVCIASIFLNEGSASYPVRHCVNVAILALLAARAKGYPAEEIKSWTAAALTMNLGLIPHQKRLHRMRGALSAEDALIVRNHPQNSVELLKRAGVTDAVWLATVAMHHEREDGSGYPTGLHGTNIVLGAKILGLADAYCTRASAGEPNTLLAHNAAFHDMVMKEKAHVDAAAASAMFKVLGTFPPGSFVRLENGEVAIVSAKGDTPATPVVHELIGRNNAPRTFPIQRNTALKLYHIREMLRLDQVNFRFSMQQVWGKDAAL